MKKVVVSVLVFSLILVGLIARQVVEEPVPDQSPSLQGWADTIGKESCAALVKGVDGLEFSVEGNKGGVLVNFFYKNLSLLSEEGKKKLGEQLVSLSKAFRFSLVSHGIELNNANCIIIMRANNSSKPLLSLVNDNIILLR